MKHSGKPSIKKSLDVRASLAAERKKIERLTEALETKRAQFEQYREETAAKLRQQEISLNAEKEELTRRQSVYDDLMVLTADFIHEQKRINERITKAVITTNQIVKYHQDEETLDLDTTNLMLNNWMSICGLADISKLRIELLEFQIAPDIFSNIGDDNVKPFKLIEKIYKSINSGFDKEARNFSLQGESFCSVNTKRILPVAFFILLDNAWKYTIPDEEITITFTEDQASLTISVRNWGPWLEDEEIPKLTQRGFRGENAQMARKDNGKGLGLSIASQILQTCSANYTIRKAPCTPKLHDGIKYGLFEVVLNFDQIVKKPSPSNLHIRLR